MTMDYLADTDYSKSEFADLYDEVSLWSAPFGLFLLDRVPMQTDLDLGAGTGFLTVELARDADPISESAREGSRRVGVDYSHGLHQRKPSCN